MNSPTHQSELSTQAVWEQLGQRLKGYFRARVSDAAAADDLVQEAFLRIHQHLDTLVDKDRLSHWVFRIAHRLVIDHYRGKSKTEGELANSCEPVAPEGKDVAGLNDRIAAWLPAAIDLLPESQREAVRLFELENVSQQEIALSLGLSLTAVKSRVRRGRAALVDIVNGCCVFELDRRGNILDYQKRERPDCCS